MAYEMRSNIEAVKEASDDAIKRALEIIGGTAEGYAADLCPVDTGNLRNSITHEMKDEHTVAIGTNVEYAPFVELGHHQQPGRYVPAIGKRLVNDYVKPKPFLRPAIENHIREYQTILEREAKKG